MTTTRKLLPYVRPHMGRLVQACACMVVVAACQTFIVYLLKPVVDEVFVTRNESALAMLVWLLPAVVAIKAAALFSQNYLMNLIGQKVSQKIRDDLFRHLNALGLDYYWERRSGEILSRVTNDLGNVQSMLHFVPLFLLRDTLTVVGLMGVLFYLNWKFALASLLVLPAAGAVVALLSKRMRRAATQSQAIMGTLYHQFTESLQGVAVVKAFHFEEGASRRFERENQDYFNEVMRFNRANLAAAPLMEFLGSLGAAALIWFGGKETLARQMSAGDFFAFMGAFLAAYMPFKNLADLNSKIQLGTASADRVFSILEAKPSVRESERAIGFAGLRRELVIEGVSFKYPARERGALRGLDLRIKSGEAVAFVGPSGSGKSTLVHLLLRFMDPTEGRFLLDGVDLRELSFATLRAQMGLVTQDTVLFNDTVMGNILLGREATREEVEGACKAADALEFITELPQGFETILGDRGQRLSGGQRQRLAIARAILKNPSLLVLDEATSNLDAASEKAVQTALDRLLHTRTVILVAHRLSTIRNADRICVLRDGAVVEQGRHEELLAAGGHYRRLHDLQATAELAGEAA